MAILAAFTRARAAPAIAAVQTQLRQPRGVGITHFRSAIDRDPAPMRLGPQNFWNALIRQRLPLVPKTTAIEQTDASIFSVGVRAIRAVLSVVHFERHECAGGLR